MVSGQWSVVSGQWSVVSAPGASCYCYRVNCDFRAAAYALCAASNAASYSGLVMRRSWYLFTYPMCSSRPTRRTCGRSGCMEARRVAGCAQAGLHSTIGSAAYACLLTHRLRISQPVHIRPRRELVRRPLSRPTAALVAKGPPVVLLLLCGGRCGLPQRVADVNLRALSTRRPRGEDAHPLVQLLGHSRATQPSYADRRAHARKLRGAAGLRTLAAPTRRGRRLRGHLRKRKKLGKKKREASCETKAQHRAFPHGPHRSTTPPRPCLTSLFEWDSARQ